MQLPGDWTQQLDHRGFARIPGLLSRDECEAIAAYWDESERFRNEIVMARHSYGEGAYRYFSNPLPDAIDRLRRSTYPELARFANVWQSRLGLSSRFPPDLDSFLEECAAAGQSKSTPLLLRYEKGGYNRLHQDRYGEVAFPLQMAILLSRHGQERDGALEPGSDFCGGELLLVEGRPRMQSKGTALALDQGEAVIFPNQIRPVESARGYARATVRHGVSEVRSGVRLALGLIFHDAG
ncbi:MAG: 2OG-Fe(II) oxygenase [Myxococcota bacterium]